MILRQRRFLVGLSYAEGVSGIKFNFRFRFGVSEPLAWFGQNDCSVFSDDKL